MKHSQRMKELERRRRRGARLLAAGESQAAVARRIGVSRQTVMRWERARQDGGMEALRRAPRVGRPERLSTQQRQDLVRLLKEGALSAGFPTELWTLPRIAQLIDAKFAVTFVPSSVWRLLGRLGWSVQRPSGQARERDERAVRTWKSKRWPELKKFAARQGRIIVFIDESGLSERPCRARTWAPRGETPVLQYSFSWKQLSVIAGLSYWRFYFRLFNGSIKSPQIVEFLKALQATIGKKLLIIWDRLQAHRSKLVRAHVEAQHGQIMIDYLPAYAPDMNPVEGIWGYLKHHAMPNYCARDLGDVAHRARSNLRSMQRRTTLVQAFWKQVDLF
ncbi:MAG TPA: IS630 family transposase [Steroidobacteraceae bacterium]